MNIAVFRLPEQKPCRTRLRKALKRVDELLRRLVALRIPVLPDRDGAGRHDREHWFFDPHRGRHRLQVRLFDDRPDVFVGGTHLMTLRRGRGHADGRHDQVVNYHHVIHSLRKKPMALRGLVYCDKLFPREEYRRAFEALIEHLPDKQACKITVELLALAHDRGCERELAEELARTLDAGDLPDLVAMRTLFGPDPAKLPSVHVQLASLNGYEALIGTGEAA